ncbi:MAG: ester cyclase [bacterium]
MSVEENKAIVRRFVEEVQSQHDLDIVGELMDTNMIDHYYDAQGLQQPKNAVEGFKKFFSGMLAAFPDIKAVIHKQVAEGDNVVTHKTLHGTHKGEFRGIPPTGKKVSVDVIDIFRIADGKMVEHWTVIDWMGLLQQLGAITPPGQT